MRLWRNWQWVPKNACILGHGALDFRRKSRRLATSQDEEPPTRWQSAAYFELVSKLALQSYVPDWNRPITHFQPLF